MEKIQSFAAMEAGSLLQGFTYEPQPLGPEEVRISVDYCGICHSDIHLIDGDLGIEEYPLVPGHEVVGRVTELGNNVQDLSLGQRVGVGWQASSCMECEWCAAGEENLCPERKATCLGRYGGFADAL